MLDDIPRRADYNGREAIRLKVSSDQTHGLVANRSKREEKRDVDGVSATEIEDRRRILVDGSALAEVRRHAIEARRESAYATDARELLEAADR